MVALMVVAGLVAVLQLGVVGSRSGPSDSHRALAVV